MLINYHQQHLIYHLNNSINNYLDARYEVNYT